MAMIGCMLDLFHDRGRGLIRDVLLSVMMVKKVMEV